MLCYWQVGTFSHLHDKFSWLWIFPVSYFMIANVEIPKDWKSPIYIKCFIQELSEIHNAAVLSTVCCGGRWHRETLVSLMPMQCFSFGTQHKWGECHCPPCPREEENLDNLGTEEVLMFLLPQMSWRPRARQSDKERARGQERTKYIPYPISIIMFH